MAQKFVGVDLGTHHVKVVVVSSGVRGVQVLEAFEEPLPGPNGSLESVPAACKVVVDVLRAHGLLGNAVGVALPNGAASYRVLSFPFADVRRITQAVPFEAEGQFPLPLEQYRYDQLVVAGGGSGRALVVAARRDFVNEVANAFRDAGLDLRVLAPGSTLLAQVVRPEVPPVNAELAAEGIAPAALVLDFGHRSTELVAVTAKGPVAARTIRRGSKHVTAAIAHAYRLSTAQAEEAKHRDAFAPHGGFADLTPEQVESGRVVGKALESLLREVEHTRLWLKSSVGFEVTKIVLAGGASRLAGFDAFIAEHTGLPVEFVQPKSNVSLRGLEGRPWLGLVTALGAAVAAARQPLIQLLDVTSRDSDASWVQQRMSSMVGIGVAMMAFGALDTIARVKALEAEQVAYQDELATLSRSVLGSGTSDPDEVEKRLREVDGEDLTSLIPKRGALELLGMIAQAAAPQDGRDTGENSTQPGSAAVNVAGEAPEQGDADDGGAPARPVLPPIADVNSGLFRDDALALEMVDIRELKVELKVSATRSSAQDRLVVKLQQLGCLQGIQKGRVRDQNERKVFEMTMDNGCFTSAPQEASNEAAEGQE